MRVIFVCTGNTCRSPMAEILFRKEIESIDIDISVCSRGLSVLFTGMANPLAIQVMKEQGLDLSKHCVRGLEEEDVKEEDLVLTMTEFQKEVIQRTFLKTNVYSLLEYVNNGRDIPDPFGGTIEEYRNCVSTLKAAIKSLVEIIKDNKSGGEL